MKFVKYCIILIIVGFDVLHFIDGYQLELVLFMIMLCIILLYMIFGKIIVQTVQLQWKIHCSTTVEGTQINNNGYIHNMYKFFIQLLMNSMWIWLKLL